MIFGRIAIALCFFACAPIHCDPDCSGGWPTAMTYACFKNNNFVTPEEIDFSKTKTMRLISESKSNGKYRQAYFVRFVKKNGEHLDSIAIHDSSDQECSESGVQVFLINKYFDEEQKEVEFPVQQTRARKNGH